MKKLSILVVFLMVAGCVSVETAGNAYRTGYAQGYVDGACLTKEGEKAVDAPGSTERFFSDFRKSSAIIYGEPQDFVRENH